ncbi:MAG: hypothetical protein ACT4QD_14150 [Acidobacteriota bacterium]
MSITTRLRAGATAALIVAALAATAADAQVPNTSSARLRAITRLRCTFSVMSVGTWTKGVPETAAKPSTLAMTYQAIDTQDGTAEAVGDSGKAEIIVRMVGSYLHFMQLDAYGALYLTTVFDYPTREGRLQAAHSRHEYTPVSLPGLTSRPEQYYGECDTSPN